MLLVLLLIVVVLLLVADRDAANVAEGQIAQQTKKELVSRQISTASDPKAEIDGFPFLTQVVGGTYKQITITMDKPKIQQVQLDDLKVVASSVHADARSVMNGTGQVTADTIAGTATMGWEAVKSLLEVAGLPKGIDPSKVELQIVNNQVQVKIPLSYNGVTFHLIAKGNLTVQSGKVIVKLTDVGSDAGSAPKQVQNLIKQYQNQLQVQVKIPAFPFQLVVNKVETTQTGVLVIASASNVKLAGS